MKTSKHYSPAFSLIEMLVVLSIVATLSSIGIFAISGTSKSVKPAASAASSLFSLARTEAIMRRVPVRVIVDTTYNPDKPNDCFRRIAVVAKQQGTDNWELISQWRRLPANAFFNPDISKRYGSEPMIGIGDSTIAYAFYEFLPNGQTSTPRALFIVTPGTLNGTHVSEIGSANRQGFLIHKLGRMTFFSNPADIPQS